MKIKSFKDACKKVGIQPILPEVSMLPEKHQKSIIAFYKLTIIIQAMNNGWEPDWNDDNQLKYYAYFFVDANDDMPSGSGLSHPLFVDAYSHSSVGSRLCFKSIELALEAAKQFNDLYADYFLIK